MKLVTYEINGEVKVGIIGSDVGKIVPVTALGYQAAEMTAFIHEIGGKITDEIATAVDAASGDDFAQCRLLSPIPQPAQDILCLGDEIVLP